MRGALAALVALTVSAGSLTATTARADLRETAGRVAETWRRAGATVAVAPTRFVSDDETITIPIAAQRDAPCVSVVLLGARGLSFHAKIAGSEDEEGRVTSVAGALTMTRCDGTSIKRIVLTSDAGRGAIEIISAQSASELPALRTILPERTGGLQPAVPEPGDLPPLPAPEKRAEVSEARARREGALVARRETWNSGADGSGVGKLTLEPGCHLVEVFAHDPRLGKPTRRGKLDLDAELRDDHDDRLLSRDRTDAPDARLETCVGESMSASVVYAGAPPNTDVLVTHAAWTIPEQLPDAWGPEPRARMAGALKARSVRAPQDRAVFLAHGPSGVTPLPLAIEPGGCYLAIATMVQGTGRGIGLRVSVGARESTDDRGTNDAAGVVAFCAGNLRRAKVEVDLRGTAVSWGLAVFRMRSGAWEPSR